MRLDPRAPTPSLPSLRRQIWQAFTDAASSPEDPWRTAALASSGGDGAHVRSVILRAVRPRQRELEFHTDSRSLKISQIRTAPWVEWLFYNPATKIQVRAGGVARIHIDDAIALAAWDRVPETSRPQYLRLCHPGHVLPTGQRRSKPAPPPSKPAFAVVITHVEMLDWLWLHPAGHLRAAFEWTRNGQAAQWLGP